MNARLTNRLFVSAAVIAHSEIDLKCCKRSELPLYIKENADENVAIVQATSAFPLIEDAIRSVRTNAQSVMSQIRNFEDTGKGYVRESIHNAQWLLDYLGDTQNQAQKAPAIVLGGLAGFILALRRGVFKKIIYTSAGALGMAAVCYPKEAKQYGGLASEEGRKYATIAYNFAYGVKKGEQPLELPKLPTFPGSLTEAIAMISDLVSPKASATLSDNEEGTKTQEVRKGMPIIVVEEEEDEEQEEEEEIDKCQDVCVPAPPLISISENYGDETYPAHKGFCLRPSKDETCPKVPSPPTIVPEPSCGKSHKIDN